MSATLGLGSAVGALGGGLMAEYASHRWIFAVPGVLAAAGAVAAWAFVPESPVRAPARVDWGGALLLAGGLTAPLFAISQGSAWGWGDAKTIGLIVGGLTVLVVCGWYERRRRQPLVDVRMLAQRTSLAANGASFFVGFGSLGSFLMFPLIAQQPESGVGFGWGATAAAALLLPQGLVQLATGRLGGSLGYRLGNRVPLVAGALIGGVPLALLAVVDLEPWLLLLVSALSGLSSGLAWAAIPNLTLEGVPPEQTSVATSMNTVTTMAGGAIGAQLSVAILAANLVAGTTLFSKTGFDLAFLLCAGGFLAAALLAATAPSPARARRAAVEARAESFAQ
jgi:MFS family permease